MWCSQMHSYEFNVFFYMGECAVCKNALIRFECGLQIGDCGVSTNAFIYEQSGFQIGGCEVLQIVF